MNEWLQWLTSGGMVLALATALAAYFRQRPAMKEAQIHGEAALWERIRALEETNAKDREACDERITRSDQRHDAAISELRSEMEEKVSTIRHDRNGLRQVLNFILSGIRKIDHHELRDLATEAEEMLARHDELLALEKGAIVGSKRRRT